MNHAFSTQFAAALSYVIGLPVFLQGDDGIVDAPRCLVLTLLPGHRLRACVMSNEGLLRAVSETRRVIDVLRQQRVQIGACLVAGSFRASGRLQIQCGEADYADVVEALVAFDLTTVHEDGALPAAA